MKLLKKVQPIEIKRTFAIADHITARKNQGNNRKFLKDISAREFDTRLRTSKNAILKMPSKKLDAVIAAKDPKRLQAYDAMTWYVATASPKELGVWTRAGNLPLRWTNGSLLETAKYVEQGFKKNSKLIKGRPRHSMPNILNTKAHLEQKERYLYPIAFTTDTGTRGRRRLKRKMKGDIDDGCMRSIALAISGRDPITIYFGVPKGK